MASSTLPSYRTQLDQQQHGSDYFAYGSTKSSAMNIPGAGLTSRQPSQQDDKSMTRECLLFPTYAFRNPKDPSEWVIRTRGWALSHNRSGAKQKFVTSLSKGVVGQNSGDHAMFEQRFKYFLAKNKRNKQFIIQAAGTHALPSDSWQSSPLSSFTSSPSSSSADLFDNNSNSTTMQKFTDHPYHQQQHRRDSDGSTDSGFQSSGVTDKDDYFYHHHHPYGQSYSDQGYDDFNSSTTAALFAMERPANPLSSILSGRRMQSTTSIPSSLSSNNSNDSNQYHGDNDDDDNYNYDDDDEQDADAEHTYSSGNPDDELPSNDHYLTIQTTSSNASTTTTSSLFTYPSFSSTVTSPTFSSASDSVTLAKANSNHSNDFINKVDGQAIFKTESSGFFCGVTHLSHQQVLQWAKEKDYCDARLLQIKSTPYVNKNKSQHHHDMNTAAPFPTSTGMVNLIEPTGISIISDIDDTIKETQILHGARTVLANTFFKESKDISGMAETYMKWYTQGASFHYVSNSPFQLLPFLHDFLDTAQFPPGSMHLRLDGSILARLIEVPGRAKRDSILGIMHDFPQRQFVLVGDSGEIDLEIYTKIAVENPGRILKIFIHDVTTPYAMQKKRAKKSTSTPTTDTISNSNNNNGLPSLLQNNSMSFSSLFQTASSKSSNNSKRYSFDIQQQQRPASLQSTNSSPSLLQAAEDITNNKSNNSLLELASSIASSSVLGLGRGRTKTLSELVNQPTLSSSTTTSTSSATSSYTTTTGSGSTSSSTLPPSQQCMQLYDRVQKAQEQLPDVDIVLFQNANDLRDDMTIQKALWQQWDDRCLNNNIPII